MKKILFLLFIVMPLCANTLNDLEHAIMKSDLPTVEQIVAQESTISLLEQDMLINLASEIIKKRENKIYVHEMQIATCNKSDLKYLDSAKLKCFAPFVATLISTGILALAVAAAENEITSGLFAMSATSCVGSLVVGAFIYAFVRLHLIEQHKEQYKKRYNAAIKIKQLLCKVKVQHLQQAIK